MPSSERTIVGGYLPGSTDGHVLVVGTGGILSQAATLGVSKGGTGLSTVASGKILYASALDTVAPLTVGSTLAIASGTIDVVANATNQKVAILSGGAAVGTRKAINLVQGSNVTLTVADDSANDRVNVTVAAAGGSGSLPATTSILKGDGAGGAVAATAGTDFASPSAGQTFTGVNTFGNYQDFYHVGDVNSHRCPVRISTDGTFVDSWFSYALSLQSGQEATWLEILNSGGTGKGIFFGVRNNDFEMWDYQAGDIAFFTNTAVQNGTERLRVANSGTATFQADANAKKVVVKGASGDAAGTSLVEFQDSGGTPLASVGPLGEVRLATIADASAPNGSLYFSSTQSKPVWKDTSGVPNPLY